ncbi:MAG: polyphosphate kinase 2 family protein [Rubripirellula sp.]|jgi:PPK2 family polyphosphate:nucleotide phosphotransferase
MSFISTHQIKPGVKVRLDDIETRCKGPFEGKKQAREFTAEINQEIRDLQYRQFVEGKQSLLVVLQAPDAAGKDGLIRKVLGQMNPQGCRTYPFKAPTRKELAHDFLWRVHHCTPAKGHVSIFNRSHYEDVLIVRVEDLVPKAVWSERYDIINSFEKNLKASGTSILKFYLHISKDEQLSRFKKRLDNPQKHWKLNVADYTVRERWDEYREAYEDVFRNCNPADAPWFVIPADNKWYRDAAVAGIVRDTLREMDPQMPPVEVDLDEIRRYYDQALDKLER